MKFNFRKALAGVLAVVLCSCAATSTLEKSWKAPDYTGGPVKKVAVLAVDERPMIRTVLEAQFAGRFELDGQAAMATYDSLNLAEIKADREATKARLVQAGADSILIVRLVGREANSKGVRPTENRPTSSSGQWGNIDWYVYYSDAYIGMSTPRSGLKQDVFLEYRLHELSSGKLVWSGLTETTLTEDTDKLAEAKRLVAMVATAMRQDGMIR